MSDGFYKLESGTIHHAPNFVRCNEYQLFRDQKDTYTYPVDGWRWFNSVVDAEAFYLPEIKQSLATTTASQIK
jgi:hypothetical protein